MSWEPLVREQIGQGSKLQTMRMLASVLED